MVLDSTKPIVWVNAILDSTSILLYNQKIDCPFKRPC